MLTQLSIKVPSRWRRHAAGPLVGLLERSGYLHRHLRRCAGLRILTYHGVCADAAAKAGWLPPHFVTAASFARQMDILARLGRVVHLPEVIESLARGQPPAEPCFALTFDDGHACTLRHALPVMSRRGIRATFFVATRHLDTGSWFLSDRLRLLGHLPASLGGQLDPRLRTYVTAPSQSKRVSRDTVADLLESAWPSVVENLDPLTVETLRPATWSELADARRAGHDVGAHTATHVILGREVRARRQVEIIESVRAVRERFHRCRAFAYPNGAPGDFDDEDMALLREADVRYAVTTTPGRCVGPLDVYRLPRTSIGLGHHEHVFALEMAGCLEGRRLRQHQTAWAR